METDKIGIIFLLVSVLTFGITMVGGLFLLIAVCAGITSLEIMTFFVAIGGIITIVCLVCGFILMIIDIIRE